MSYRKQVQKCFRSLLIHRLRTILSTLGVLFGVVAVVTMLSIGEGAKQETLEQIAHLGMQNVIIRQNELSEEQIAQAREKRSSGLTVEDSAALEKGVSGIRLLSPLKVIEAAVTGTSKEISPEILAVTGHFYQVKNLRMDEGRFICQKDVQDRSLVCVLGEEIAKSLGNNGHTGKTVRIENLEYQIVGVLDSKKWASGKSSAIASRNLNKSIFIPLGTESALPRRKSDALSEIVLHFNDSGEINAGAQLSKRILDLRHAGVEDYQVVIPQELLNQAQRTQQTFNLVLGSIAAISLLVGGIGIMNIMLATVSERTREIGIRRAVGANQVHIVLQFLVETLLLTLSGAILGIAIGILFSYMISAWAGWQTIVTAWSIFLSLGMASAVGLFSGLYPAMKAAAMNPITALRHD